MANEGASPREAEERESLRRIEQVKRRLIILACSGIVAFLFVFGLYLYQFGAGGLSTKRDEWGQFGDYIGGTLNPLFTLLTFIGILVTIVLQARELHYSTIELRTSSEALNTQATTTKLQQFENAFFQLLNLHNTIVNELDLRSRHSPANVISRGRDCFRVFVDRYKDRWNAESGDKESIEAIAQAYERFYEENQHEVGHYFRLLYNIVKFVDQSDIKNKKFYTNLIRAQLSADELTMLFFNCLSRWGNVKFKPLIERYALLKTLPVRTFFTQRVRNHYSSDAYAGT